MTNHSSNKRMDTASRTIKASPQAIYNAFVDSQALVMWLPPKGMKGRIFEFDPRAGGTYRMSLTYLENNRTTQGKTSIQTSSKEVFGAHPGRAYCTGRCIRV